MAKRVENNGIFSFASTRYGALRVINTDDVISESLRLYGEWAQLEIEIVSSFISPGQLVIDVGAFIGTHSLAFSNVVGASGRILAFEPRAPIAAILQDNILRSPFSNIEVRVCGLGASRESIRVRSIDLLSDTNFGGLALRDSVEDSASSETVSILTLDSLKLDSLDFIKADVEGMEIDVLRGARKSIARFRPAMFLEANSLNKSIALLEWSRANHYLCYGLLTRAFNPENYNGNTKNIFGEAAEAALMMVPAERHSQYSALLEAHRLPQLENFDDLALLLLHKPQYPSEILSHGSPAKILGTNYPSPLAYSLTADNDRLKQSNRERDSEVTILNQSLASRDSELKEQHVRLTELSSALTERDSAIQIQKGWMAELQQTVKERDFAIEEQKSGIAALQQVLTDRDGAIGEQNRTIAALHQVLAERDGAIVQQNHRITMLQQDLTERDGAIGEQNHRIAALRQDLLERDAAIGEQNHRIAALQQVLTERDNAIGQQNHRIDALHQHLLERDVATNAKNERIAELIQALNDRESALETSSLRIASLQDSLSGLHSSNDDLNDRILELNRALDHRDAEVQELRGRFSGLNLTLAKREAAIRELNLQTERFNQSLAKRETSLSELRARLAEATQNVSNRDSAISELHSRFVNLSQNLEAQQIIVKEQKTLLQSLNQSLTDRESTISRKDIELSRLSETLNKREMALADLLVSKSWKVTKPFRKVTALMRGVQPLEQAKETDRNGSDLNTGGDVQFLSDHTKEVCDCIRQEFDVDYYLKRYPDVAAAGFDPVAHYVEFGADELRDPSPRFSTQHYLQSNSDVTDSGINPLFHYVMHGRAENRAVSSPEEFDRWCRENSQDISAISDRIRQYFDTQFYLERYPDVAAAGLDPVHHYIEHGAAELRDPSPQFSTQQYLLLNRNVRESGVNPLDHFVSVARAQDRSLNAPSDGKLLPEEIALMRLKIQSEFDIDYYLGRNEDVASSGMDPIVHYLEHGAAEFRDPCAWFSTRYYLQTHSDVDQSGINPFFHFVTVGREQGRSWCSPEEFHAQSQRESNGYIAEIARQISAEFDVEFYLDRYPDIAIAGIDPLVHYIQVGSTELRDPSPHFSTRYYLDSSPDVRTSGVNPFLHFILHGRHEGRLGVPPGGYRARQLEQLEPLHHTIRSWRIERKTTLVSEEMFVNVLTDAVSRTLPQIILSFSHDNYTEIVGGIQLCLLIEQAAFEEDGATYVSFHPAQPLPVLCEKDQIDLLQLNIVCNGRTLGTANIKDIIRAIERLSSRIQFSLVVHAMLGHAPESISRIAAAAGTNKGLFWVHDYFSICPGYNLLRNRISYCGAPAVDSAACSICLFGETRREHAARVRTLFKELEFDIVSPSAAALDIWLSNSGLSRQEVRIHPHCQIEWLASRQMKAMRQDEPVRVAFLGYPAIHKGWPVFRDLLDKFGRNPAFEFHYLGGGLVDDSRLKITAVSVNRDNRNAMVEAISRNSIDFTVLWSLWPETFCFTSFEAIAGGAHVLTYSGSGNIAQMISTEKMGRAFNSEAELVDFFQSGAAHEYVRKHPRPNGPAGRLVYNRMSADILRLT